MKKTVALVTNQHCCDRIIHAARELADQTNTELIVMGVQDSEYKLNPEAIEYLFHLSKQNKATMRLLFSSDKMQAICNIVGRSDCIDVVTGMPGGSRSILYRLWKQFPQKRFHLVDDTGTLTAVSSRASITA